MIQSQPQGTPGWWLTRWQIFVALLSIMLFAATIVLQLNTPENIVPAWLDVALHLQGVLMVLLGLLIRTYRPENRIWWVCFLSGLLFQLSNTGTTYIFHTLHRRGMLLPLETILLWFVSAPIYGIVILEFILLPMWFPNGAFSSESWQRVGRIVLVLMSAAVVIYSVLPGPLGLLEGTPYENTVSNPFGLSWSFIAQRRKVIEISSIGSLLVGLLIAVASIIARWRRASPEVRQQIKIVAVFIGLVFTPYPLAEIAAYVGTGPLIRAAYNVALLILWLGYPLVIGAAILFNRLFDIDLIIRRTFTYTVITGLLAGVYFGAVTLLQSAFVGITGQESPLAVVASTLGIAALFNPMRRRVQNFLDRRFNRRRYNAEQTLEAFAEAMRDNVDMDHLSAALIKVVEETMQPSSVGLWIASEAQQGERNSGRI